MQKYLIKTKRLGLRLLEKEDINYLVPLEEDPEVKKYFPDGKYCYPTDGSGISEH